MRTIAIIGAGGINSWVVKHLNDMTKTFDKDDIIYIKIFDKDIVEEKNLKRGNQNFEVKDLMENKAQKIGEKYNFDFEAIYITEDNISILDNFQDIILGVDNHKTRKIIYEYCLKNNKYLLDLRAQGTLMSYNVIDGTKDFNYYKQKYFSNEEVMNRKGSCQLDVDIQNDHIENANKTIAFLGVYCIYLKHLRGEKPSNIEWKFAY